MNQANGIGPYAVCRIADVGGAWVEKPFELEGAHAEISAFFAVLHEERVVPVSAVDGCENPHKSGGGRTVTLKWP